MHTAQPRSKGIPFAVALFASLLTLALALILLSPFQHLFPILPYSAQSCLRQEPTHPRIFDPNHALERDSFESTPIQEQLSWEDLLMPDSGGGILAQQPPRDPFEHHQGDSIADVSYGISMFHQLHCLIILRGLIFPETSHKKVNSTLPPHSGNPRVDRTHWAHCFDYIAQVCNHKPTVPIVCTLLTYAQAIICSADDTIEQPKKAVVNGRTVFNVNGVGAVHQCRDSERLWEVSMDSMHEKVDMRVWRNGIGARAFFGRGGSEPKYDVPDIYTKGM
ncbi:hypothetical protein BDV59DRAFT_202355 [Aspergillus ambiguus]|uniref:uncharacterized protein n=1 Tax=Aspergillus ambiguus TaxID=176160 RepID=UPI003CCE28E7